MRQRRDYLIIGLTLIGLAVAAASLPVQPVAGSRAGALTRPLPTRPGRITGPERQGHGLAAILFVVLILLLVENTVADAVEGRSHDPPALAALTRFRHFAEASSQNP